MKKRQGCSSASDVDSNIARALELARQNALTLDGLGLEGRWRPGISVSLGAVQDDERSAAVVHDAQTHR